MAYIIQLPAEIESQVKKLLDKLGDHGKPNGNEIRFLATVYYRYMRKNIQDVDKEVDITLSCGPCQAGVLMNFRTLRRNGVI